MMLTMPRYEVRYNENEEWREISELELMDRLYKLYHRVTPAIKEMLSGKELNTPDDSYRLKRQYGNPHEAAGVHRLVPTVSGAA
jgi:hypothetical protein